LRPRFRKACLRAAAVHSTLKSPIHAGFVAAIGNKLEITVDILFKSLHLLDNLGHYY
jgi:hypothetical protein